MSWCFKVTHWQWVAFFVITLLALRLFLTLTHENYLGIDGGAYVLSALEVQGKDITNVGFARPPLAPGWLLVPFIHFLGIDVGYKVWTVLFSVLPLLPVYLLTRDLVNRSAAIFALAFFSVDMMQMEMMVTGSLPLIGFTFIGLSLWCIFRLTHQWSRLHFWLLAACVGILPYINQTAAGIGMIVLPAATIALFIFVYKDKGRMAAGPYQCNIVFYVLPAAFIGGLIALGALPWYLTNAPGNSELRFPGPILQMVHWTDPALLLQFPVVATVVYFLWRETKDYRVRTMAVLIGMLGVMILFLSWDEAIINILYRSRYFLALLIYPSIAWLLCRTWPLLPSLKEEWATVLPMVAVWLALLWGQVVVFSLQSELKDMVSPQTVEALEIASQGHPEKSIITNAYSLSHWVSAMNQVESPNTWTLEPSPFYQETATQINCVLGWIDSCSPEQATKSLDAEYILIDTRFPTQWEHDVWGSPQRDAWATLYNAQWLILRYNQSGVQLWEIKF